MSRFTRHSIVNGFSEKDDYFIITFTSLERISDIELFSSADNIKWEKIKTKNLVAEDASYSNFYNGLKLYKIPLLKNHFFRLDYNVSCSEIKMLGSVLIIDRHKTDSIINRITISKPLVFSWHLPARDTSYTLTMDSIENASVTSYIFISSHKKNTPQNDCSIKIYCSIHPAGISPEAELRGWFSTQFKPNDGISQQTINEINKITESITDTLEITKKLFTYVKNSISYIDIESGYGAWIPRKADDILAAHKGDCKDMANVVYQMLKYKNIDCCLGIMPTISHRGDFEFPSLDCANHMICLALVQNKWYYLDATDRDNFFELPSRHSQGRSVFTINGKTTGMLTVPVVEPEQNKILHTISFSISDTGIAGTWDIVHNGHNSIQLLDHINNFSEKNIHEFFDNYLKSLAPKLKITSYTYEVNEGKVICHILFRSSATMISHSDKKNYLSLKYLPAALRSMEKRECRHFMYTSLYNDFFVNFHFIGKVELANPHTEKVMESGMEFNMESRQAGSNDINLHFNFRVPYLEYDETLFSNYENMSRRIDKCFSNVLIYQ